MKVNEKWVSSGLECLKEEFGEKKVNKAIDAVKKFEIEIPSWVFGKFGGGRFGEYMPPAPARNIYDKLDDAAFIYKLTGVTPRIATHILWDFSDNGMDGNFKIAEKVKKEAIDRGIDFGAVNPTYFLKGSHRGSFSSIDEDTRKRYIDQTILGGEIANKLGNNLLTLWFPDGSNYPGQLSLSDTYLNMRESLEISCSKISTDVKILIEYKVFEPGTYSTTISDWGTAYLLKSRLGENTGVLIDLGHHYHGKNIEQIVAMLIAENIPAGFHFNNRYAADDDQSVA
jgi:L-rhamnose isomerase/sugar isomerase